LKDGDLGRLRELLARHPELVTRAPTWSRAEHDDGFAIDELVEAVFVV